MMRRWEVPLTKGCLFTYGGECNEKRGNEGGSKNGIGGSHGDDTSH